MSALDRLNKLEQWKFRDKRWRPPDKLPPPNMEPVSWGRSGETCVYPTTGQLTRHKSLTNRGSEVVICEWMCILGVVLHWPHVGNTEYISVLHNQASFICVQTFIFSRSHYSILPVISKHLVNVWWIFKPVKLSNWHEDGSWEKI